MAETEKPKRPRGRPRKNPEPPPPRDPQAAAEAQAAVDQLRANIEAQEFMAQQNRDIMHFWDARAASSPPYTNPDILWNAAREYFTWNEEHPLWESKIVSYMGVASVVPVRKMRAMTHNALCIFLDITPETWESYKLNPDLIPVVNRVENVIHDQKLQGGAADLLNANLVIRDLKLKDHQQVDAHHQHTHQLDNTTTLDLAKAVAALLEKGVNILDVTPQASQNQPNQTRTQEIEHAPSEDPPPGT